MRREVEPHMCGSTGPHMCGPAGRYMYRPGQRRTRRSRAERRRIDSRYLARRGPSAHSASILAWVPHRWYKP
jgi:hypothetical protein